MAAPTMASLPSLPNELIHLICNDLHPATNYQRGGLGALAALTRTNRRLWGVVDPVLYHVGVSCHAQLPLAWAAKRGVPGTLEKALAAGAEPDHVFRLTVPSPVMYLASDLRRANADWDAHDPAFWLPNATAFVMGSTSQRRWARDLTPTLTGLDVFAPTTTTTVPKALTRDPDEDDASSGSEADGVFGDEDDDLSDQEDDSEPDGSDMSDEGDDEDNTWHGLGVRALANHLFRGFPRFREYSALHLAAEQGHIDIIDILLKHGAHIDSQSYWLCHCQSPRSLWQSILDQGSTRLAYPSWDQTPLHVAVCSSRIDAAKLLVSRGAFVAASGGACGFSPTAPGTLHQAAAAGHVDFLKYLLETLPALDIDQPDREGLTPFYHAYANGHWDSTVPFLLARGANINLRITLTRDSVVVETTPLGEACRLGRFEDALKLIDLGADLTLGVRVPWFEEDGQDGIRQPSSSSSLRTHISLLHLCCIDFTKDAVMFDDVKENACASGLAQQASLSKLIARLVAAGLSPDAQWDPGDGYEETPLSIAVRHLNVPAIKALLAAGADVNACNSKGRNALMSVVLKPACHPCTTRGGSHGPNWGEWFFLPCARALHPCVVDEYPDRWRIARLLLDAGTRISDKDSEGNTVLHLFLIEARDVRHPDSWMDPRVERQLIRLFLSRGADPLLPNRAGTSPLQLAVERQHLDFVTWTASQSRIDLVDSLTMDEIERLFAAVPWDGRHPSRYRYHHALTPAEARDSSPGINWTTVNVDTTSWRLIDALMSMDSSGRLASNTTFICERMNDSHRSAPVAELAEILCFRGLEMGSFDSKAKITLLRAAVKGGRWTMAQQLVEECSIIMLLDNINVPDCNGQTLLSQLTSSTHKYHREMELDLDLRLVQAGADIHLPITTNLIDTRALGINTMTPLKEALMASDAFHIEEMLRLQPIRGNPHAEQALYLHWTIAFPYLPGTPKRYSSLMWEARDTSLRALLAAGADTTQLDENGITPLLLLCRICDGNENLPNMCHWFKPLSRGVDLHQRDPVGLSVIDYVERFLLEENRSARVLKNYLEIVTSENGVKGIKWLK
ncbi:hypothetical protein VTI74DRAFT_2024 [Chaetomium olivicolor]